MIYATIPQGCPNCKCKEFVQMPSHPADTFFIYCCDGCDCYYAFGKGGRLYKLNEDDWRKIYEARNNYDREE